LLRPPTGGEVITVDYCSSVRLFFVELTIVCLVPGEELADKHGTKLYKPTSKLLEKKTAAATLLKPKEEEKPERPVCTADFVAHLMNFSCFNSARNVASLLQL